MSDTNARRISNSTQFITEKTVLTEFLHLYKGFPCLWDQKHMLYANKEARQNACEVLLEKYKMIQEDATIPDVKRRIEYMRCAYRREHKKVIMARLRGDDHKPILWYYNLLTFLNDHSALKLHSHYEDNYQIEETHEIEDSDEEDPEPKRIKTSSSNNAIFVSEQHSDDVLVREDIFGQDRDQPCIVPNEPEAFGRTVGFQLSEITHEQRIYAEKLISDVIFQARLGKLSAGATLCLNED